MKNNYLFIVSILIGVAALFTAVLYNPNTSIVFIRTGQVLDEYLGTKEADVIYKNKLGILESQLDTIKVKYNAMVDEYNAKKSGMTKKNCEAEEMRLRNKYEEIQRFKIASEQRISDENNQYFEGILNQINAFAKEYAIKKGYDYILGTTKEGNLMYAKDENDITEAFIKSLNEYYQTGN